MKCIKCGRETKSIVKYLKICYLCANSISTKTAKCLNCRKEVNIKVQQNYSSVYCSKLCKNMYISVNKIGSRNIKITYYCIKCKKYSFISPDAKRNFRDKHLNHKIVIVLYCQKCDIYSPQSRIEKISFRKEHYHSYQKVY